MDFSKTKLLAVGLLIGSFPVVAYANMLRLHTKMDANYDGCVDRSEFFDFWQADFERRDQNQDGALAAAEVDAALLQSADQDSDASVSWQELRSLRQRHYQGMDKDQDGCLTVEEMLGTAKAPAKPTPAEPSSDSHLGRLHRMMDRNQDQFVTTDEFMARWQEGFERRDSNHDQQLSVAEVGAPFVALADSNSDGVVEWPEERQLRQRQFARMDSDADQRVSLQEMIAAAGSNR